ncbi:hypothetical protein KFK09_028943 [Dendrobium nobile]|uniref:Uncharacterized protein n=1 Tax=Dendrobium nobile TaxID=94219 RepID=A0A8T3A4L1_DENNO|nr:hypothetical protein KFK09_028943 [Dendrobium nobile]
MVISYFENGKVQIFIVFSFQTVLGTNYRQIFIVLSKQVCMNDPIFSYFKVSHGHNKEKR